MELHSHQYTLRILLAHACLYCGARFTMEDMQGSNSEQPFGLLGDRLRHFREIRQESVAEVSGAVEIDTEVLERIERGEECPSEDILTLLISHFGLQENEAVQLWEWAGFAHVTDGRSEGLQDIASRASIVLVAIDARVMYTDGVSIAADKKGVVLNFMQPGFQPQQLPAARIGMSYEQAEQLFSVLQQTLLRKKYLPNNRLLPPGDTN